jgi:hypothetical protein
MYKFTFQNIVAQLYRARLFWVARQIYRDHHKMKCLVWKYKKKQLILFHSFYTTK